MEQILYHFYNKDVRKVVIHMKHPIKLILVLLTITMLSALFVTKDIIYEGYSMYRTAVREERTVKFTRIAGNLSQSIVLCERAEIPAWTCNEQCLFLTAIAYKKEV